MEIETPKPVPAVEANGTKWDLVADNKDLIDSIIYKAVGLKRIRREDAKEAIVEAKLLARQLADRHVGTAEEYKHHLGYVLKRRLMYDKTRATDAMDWLGWQGLPRDGDEAVNSDESDELTKGRKKRPAASCPDHAIIASTLREDLIRTLPPRQQVMARLLASGKNIYQIARRLGRKPSQVAHLHGEMTKCANRISNGEEKENL